MKRKALSREMRCRRSVMNGGSVSGSSGSFSTSAFVIFSMERSDRDSAVVQVLDTSYNAGIVTYHLGKVLEVVRGK